jgi:hypothetical protein
MVASVDGAQVMSVPVPTNTWADYTAPVSLAAGSHTVSVGFTNDYAKTCDRNLRVDLVEASTP